MVKNIFKKANWIWCESEGQADEYGEFYSSFNYDGEKNVKLKISADSNYAVYINGKFEVFGQYADFPYDKIYDGHWLTGDDSRDYIAIHRVAIAVASRGSGASAFMMNYAAELARNMGRRSVRIDTHEGNTVMRRMLEKHGFVHRGTIFLRNGDRRVAYERVL